MDDSRKHLPYAPYLMYMIERVTKITFKKDVKHEPVHLSSRDADALPSSRHRSSSSSAPVVDDPPIPIPYRAPSDAPSSSRRHGNRSMIKRVLHSIMSFQILMIRLLKEMLKKLKLLKLMLILPLMLLLQGLVLLHTVPVTPTVMTMTLRRKSFFVL